MDGKTYPAIRIPAQGGSPSWTTVNMGAYTFAHGSYHTVSLVWDTPNISVNWRQVQEAKNVH